MAKETSKTLTNEKNIRVLSISGGGIRGIYAAAYLDYLSGLESQRRNIGSLDIGKGFNLIAGTSTGAIIACALAAGLKMREIVGLYKENGKKIFPRKLTWKSIFYPRSRYLKQGNEALKKALTDKLGQMTIGKVWIERQIALAIPAVDMTDHKGWVFKTPHLNESYDRDGKYTLVDVCLASTAAPMFRSLAKIKDTEQQSGGLFADGGLWANNPILVALIDALKMVAPDGSIEIFSLNSCLGLQGDPEMTIHGSVWDWRFGGKALLLALDSQDHSMHEMARLLKTHLKPDVNIIRFPRDPVSAAYQKYLDIDETRDKALEALIKCAETDAKVALSKMTDEKDDEGRALSRLFASLPQLQPSAI